MNIYLDIDEVLLANNKTAANYAAEFLRFVVTKYPNTTYWLSARCHGDEKVIQEQLKPFFDAETFECIKQIKPTDWDTFKTEAIDFNQPFLWFDDDLYDEEWQAIKLHNATDNYIHIDLTKNPNQLANFLRSFPIPVN
jgi:hypothetical protein